jgi:hypothetical protein
MGAIAEAMEDGGGGEKNMVDSLEYPWLCYHVEMVQGKSLMGLYSRIYRGVQQDGLHDINAVINGGTTP